MTARGHSSNDVMKELSRWGRSPSTREAMVLGAGWPGHPRAVDFDTRAPPPACRRAPNEPAPRVADAPRVNDASNLRSVSTTTPAVSGTRRPGAARTPDDDAGLSDIGTIVPRSDFASASHLPPARSTPPSDPPVRPSRAASLRLADLGLPDAVVDRFVSSGVRSGEVYPWQRAAIDEGADGSSLVYCAPTSGGKSLVASVLLARKLLARAASGGAGRALVILPFHSLVNEKVDDLGHLLAPMYKKRGSRDRATPDPVRGFAGAEGTPLARPLGPGQEAVAVTTIEKASIAVSRLAKEGRLHELCAVVVDELHMVGEEGRGGALEATLAKLRFAARKGAFRRDSDHSDGNPGNPSATTTNRRNLADDLQIIAMSATVSHASLERLAGWLDARLFVTNFRPVPLVEHVVAGGTVHARRRDATLAEADGNANGNDGARRHPMFDATRQVPASLTIDAMNAARVGERDRVAARLVAESWRLGHSCLVFCPSRNKTRDLAGALARALGGSANDGDASVARARETLLRKLAAAAEGRPDPDLVAAARVGVGFHHAHLRRREKEAIEEGFRRGAIRALTCTTTLAAGVNLPARRVVIIEGQHGYSASSYRQMAGRAGRAGHADAGEAFVVPGDGGGVSNPGAGVLENGGEARSATGTGPRVDPGTAARVDSARAAFDTVASRLPALTSQLLSPPLPSESAAVQSRVAESCESDVARLASVVLQCIAAGTFRTERDGFDLMRSTFAFGVAGDRVRLRAGLDGALRRLRDDGLAETTWDADGETRVWTPTARGAAAHRSALPLRHACALHDDLSRVVRHGLHLHSRATPERSHGRAHLLFLCAPRGGDEKSRGKNPLAALDWSAWYPALSSDRDPSVRELGELLGVRVAFALRMCRVGGGGGGGGGSGGSRAVGDPRREERERHGRFAAALALRDLLDVGDAGEVAARYATLAERHDLSVGALQNLQADVAANAAMAANLAETAGWRAMAELLTNLSRDLDAGVARELNALMAVAADSEKGWAMTAGRARGLFAAGLRDPGAVAAAAEEDVVDAVRRADRPRGGAGGDNGTAAGTSARRAAREIVAACRAYEMRRLAAVLDANEPGVGDDERGGEDPEDLE